MSPPTGSGPFELDPIDLAIRAPFERAGGVDEVVQDAVDARAAGASESKEDEG